MQRQIKFRIIYKGAVVGYERLTSIGWAWMDLRLNPDKGERWTIGAYPTTGEKYEREQFTGLQDKNKVDIYDGDIIEVDWLDARYKVTKHTVEWNPVYAAFIFPGGTPHNDCAYFKVIGNIHDK